MNWSPDILNVFSFQRLVDIASVSDDGKSMPKIYLLSDLIRQKSGKGEISAVVKINGEDVQSYLEKVAAREQYIDADARFNKLVYKSNSTQSQSSFLLQTGYDGPSTTFTFANGTTSKTYDNVAKLSSGYNFDGVDSGAAFFQAFCQGAPSDSAGARRSTLTKRTDLGGYTSPHILYARQAIPQDYPTPVVIHSAGAVAGYFMNAPGFQDVAVLKIPTFQPDSTADPNMTEFQSVVEQFLANATSAGKKKLIVDLRENGGGATNLLLDTFMQLFPSMTPFSAQRYRATEQFRLIGNSVSEIYNNQTLSEKYQAFSGTPGEQPTSPPP
jgi:hypothetical protein